MNGHWLDNTVRNIMLEAKDDKKINEFRGKRFQIRLLDVDRLVKVNNLKEVTNPVFFVKSGQPTSDGLLSNEIFGITKYDRANTFAYVDLKEYFIDPLFYQVWCKLDKKVKECVAGTRDFTIDKTGLLQYDDEH